MLWVRCAPGKAEEIGESLGASPHVRYAAFVMGDHPILVDVTSPDVEQLRQLITSIPGVEGVESALVLQAFKRGGVLTAANAEPTGSRRAAQ